MKKPQSRESDEPEEREIPQHLVDPFSLPERPKTIQKPQVGNGQSDKALKEHMRWFRNR